MNTHPPFMEEEIELREYGEKGRQLRLLAMYGSAVLAVAALVALLT